MHRKPHQPNETQREREAYERGFRDGFSDRTDVSPYDDRSIRHMAYVEGHRDGRIQAIIH